MTKYQCLKCFRHYQTVAVIPRCPKCFSIASRERPDVKSVSGSIPTESHDTPFIVDATPTPEVSTGIGDGISSAISEAASSSDSGSSDGGGCGGDSGGGGD